VGPRGGPWRGCVVVMSAGKGKADDLVPGGEACGHLVAVLLGAEPVAAGQKCDDIPLSADRNRCGCPDEVNFFIARSRCLVGVLGPVIQIL
jgi:hypothetical protein